MEVNSTLVDVEFFPTTTSLTIIVFCFSEDFQTPFAIVPFANGFGLLSIPTRWHQIFLFFLKGLGLWPC